MKLRQLAPFVVSSLLGVLLLWSRVSAAIPINGWLLQTADAVSASGAVISLPSYVPSHWFGATVPGTVLTSLVNDHVYAEPLYGENNRKIPDSLCLKSYWYRTDFRIPKAYAGHRIWLNFAGVNYFAVVWVNGHEVDTIRGAFVRGILDITSVVTPGATAGLAVEILPPPHPGTVLEQTRSLGTGKNGGAIGQDSPTFLATVGWDWIPGIRDRDIGIWQGVSLSATGPVVLRDPYVTTKLPPGRTDSADLTVRATLSNVTGSAQTGTLSGTFSGPAGAFQLAVHLAPFQTKTISVSPPQAPGLHWEHPRLWWPNGYGAQNLYTVHLKYTLLAHVDASDTQDVSFGVRSIAYFPTNGSNLTVIVNGVPIFCRGGNWGMDEAMKRSPRERLEAQIRLHHDAHLNMIRNWIGMSDEEDFFDLCDRYGILVWNDFWLANPADGPDPNDPALFLSNARETLLRYRNHPSIAIWCGRNEGDPPPTIESGLVKLVSDLDGVRFYQPHSSHDNGVGGGGPYAYRNPAGYFQFNDAFHTEIGLPSIPTLEAIEAMMPRADWGPVGGDWSTLNDDWAEHDLCSGAQGGDRYPHVLESLFGPLSGLPDFVRKAQMVNYDSYRAIFEGRNSRLFAPATGVLLWMSNPAQPSFVWQLYSYDLEPNAAEFGAEKACEPLHVQLDPEGTVQIINTTARSLRSAVATAQIYDLHGRLLSSIAGHVDAPACTATNTFTLVAPKAESLYFVRLNLTDSLGLPRSSNFYWRSQPTAGNDYTPNDFTPLCSLPAVPVDWTAYRTDTEGQCQIVVQLWNRTKTPALMAHIQLRTLHSGKRVLPVYYSDNYVSLMPGDRCALTIRTSSALLKDDKPVIALDGWNVVAGLPRQAQAVIPSKSPVALVTNSEAEPGKSLPKPVRSPLAGVFKSIACGGPPAGAFVDDGAYVDGGRPYSFPEPVDTASAGEAAGPEQIYQSERFYPAVYTISVPAPDPGKSYTVRLHFAEHYFNHAGGRLFDVTVNGRRALTNYDIFAAAGGKDRAVTTDISGVLPDVDGNIVIALTPGDADMPVISGIQIMAATPLPSQQPYGRGYHP